MASDLFQSKSLNSELPKPIAFSSWKHHLGYVKQELSRPRNALSNDSFILEIVQFLGDSNIDFYFGTLDLKTITSEVIQKLESEKVYNLNEYKNWLISEGLDYKCIFLSDGSNWTLRLGQNDSRYIHIHLSRHSKKTVRVKSSTLKTVYAYLLYYGLSDDDFTIEKVNFVRRKFVKLPSFKPTSALAAVSRILDLFLI
jgi:hypothetical protein